MFRITNRDKSERLHKLILMLKDVKYIEFYDDKLKHIESIKNISNKFSNIIIKTIKI